MGFILDPENQVSVRLPLQHCGICKSGYVFPTSRIVKVVEFELQPLIFLLLRDKPQDPYRLQVVRERIGRAAGEVVEVYRHGVLPMVRAVSSGSAVVDLDARRSAAMRRASR